MQVIHPASPSSSPPRARPCASSSSSLSSRVARRASFARPSRVSVCVHERRRPASSSPPPPRATLVSRAPLMPPNARARIDDDDDDAVADVIDGCRRGYHHRRDGMNDACVRARHRCRRVATHRRLGVHFFHHGGATSIQAFVAHAAAVFDAPTDEPVRVSAFARRLSPRRNSRRRSRTSSS